MPQGKRGDKKLHITFNEMGHGDSVLISLPNGQMLLIDCGSMRWDGNFWNPKRSAGELRANAEDIALNDKRFLLNNKVIDICILTHPDRDHCSELAGLFYPLDSALGAVTKIKRVYYSENFSTYGKHGVTFTLWNMKQADRIYSFTLNQDDSEYARVTGHDYHGTVTTTYNIGISAPGTAEILKKSRVAATRDFVKIMDGTALNGVACGVYILAGNVKAYQNVNDQSSQDNRGSIVTMIIYGDKKFLFMGDSTLNTEKFLIDTYGNLIKNVELLHIPHHASFTTSSGDNFVAHVNPRYAVITAAYDSGAQLALPRHEVIDSYHGGTRLLNKPGTATADQKKIYCYEKQIITKVLKKAKDGTALKTSKVEVNQPEEYPATKHIWCTGSHGAIDFDYEEKLGGSVDQM
jgi:beta-lactamase superfamily II metal-dependent hydrolase